MKFLNEILQEELRPIREKRNKLESDPEYIKKVLYDGTMRARKKSTRNIKRS